MDSPGTWESLGGDPFSDSRWCRGSERDLAHAESLCRMGANRGRREMGAVKQIDKQHRSRHRVS